MVRKINSNKFGVIEYAIDTEEDLEKLPRKETDNTVYAILNKNGKRLVYLYSKELKDYILINGDLEGINVELENINEQLDTITSRVSSIEQNGVGATSSVEPSELDIPKVFFEGDINGMSKENEKTLRFAYKSKSKKIDGYVKMKWQGKSSLSYAKKNFTIKMFKEESCTNKDKHTFKNWNYSTNKYVLKANYIDHSHCRNIVSARIWNDIVKARADYNTLPTEYFNMPNGGGVDGFPIKVYINGKYEGIYTWNIGKEGWTYGMQDDSNTNYAVLCGENYGSGCFKSLAKIDGTDWSLEFPDILAPSIKTSWNNAISFVMNNSGNSFKNGLSAYFDVNSLIDYYIFAYFSCGLDSLGKNQIYATYDGVKWYAHMYDMDSTWGLYWNGSSFVSAEYRCQEDYESGVIAGGNVLYTKLSENFGKEIYQRYQELRNSVLSIDNVIDRFERFTDIISSDLYNEDIQIYSGIPSQASNNIQQIRNYITARATYVDGKIAEINTDLIAIEGLTIPSTLTVVEGLSSTLPVTYSPTNTTQRGISWVSNNENIATVSNGVVTGVNVGNCTVTCTSTDNPNLSSTCNVTIEEYTVPILDGEILNVVVNETVRTTNLLEDTTGNNNNISLYNFTHDGTNGVNGNNLIFNGNQYLKIDNINNIDFTGDFTLVYTMSNITSVTSILLHSGAWSGTALFCTLRQTNISIENAQNSGSEIQHSKNLIERGVYAIRVTDSVVNIFIDGVKLNGSWTINNQSQINTSSPFYMFTENGTKNFGSLNLENIRMFNRGLTDDEIKTIE